VPNWENLGIAGAALFIILFLGGKLIDGWNKQKENSVSELCRRIDSFTSINSELLRVLTQSLVVFEKDQKEILSNLQQLISLSTFLTSCVSKLDERTEKCKK
jgi:hypothetical protein